MKKAYLVFISLWMAVLPGVQGQCTLKLDAIVLDTAASNCNHLFFKYTYSGGTPTSYHWSYGDCNSCTCFKPKNVYNKNGTFKVCGKITDINGCADSMCIFVTVNCSDPCELSGIGIYSFDSLSYACDEFEFNTITSSNAKKIKWDFGDGDSSTSKFIVHTYKQNGIYKVKLHIEDSIGCADSAELSVTIDCPPPCTFTINKIDTSTGADCKTKIFNLQTNIDPVTVNWDYGDDHQTITNGKRSSRQYADTGLYKLCVIALDSNNCRDTGCQWVKVSCRNNVSFDELDKYHFNLYPNPAGKALFIDIPLESVYDMYDLTLKKIAGGNLVPGINEIDLEQFHPGTYIIKIQDINTIYCYRIVKE